MPEILKLKQNGTWVGVPAIKGEKGDRGEKGYKGDKGDNGRVHDVILNNVSTLSGSDAIINTVDNVNSTSLDPLSAKQGKLLNDRIDNLSNIGRFLSTWNCATGKPLTEPTSLPYTYHTGDYFRIGAVAVAGQTNYKPNGSQYTGTASTTVETSTEVTVGDIYYYDGTNWLISYNHLGGLVTDVKVGNNSIVSNSVATIDSNHKIDSDFITDTNQTNKFVSSTDKTRFNALNVQYVDSYTPTEEIDLSIISVDPCGATYTFTWDGTGLKNTNCDPSGIMYGETYAYGKVYLAIEQDTTVTIGYSQSSEERYDYGIISVLDYELSKDIIPESGINVAFHGQSQGSQSGTITLNATRGAHFFTFKYIKDSGGASGTDSFTITSITINGAGFAGLVNYDTQEQLQELPVDLSNTVSLNTAQTITAKKSILITEPIVTGGQETALNVLSTHTNEEMGAMWAGRMKIGNKNKTFLLGVYKQHMLGQPAICGIGAHSWSDSVAEEGAAWEDIYLNPDGNKAVYIGSHDWRANTGWFKVQNTGSDYNGKTYCNRGNIQYPSWREVATIYDSSTSATNETWSASKLNTQFGYKENTSNKVTSISSSSTNTQYPSAKLVYDQLVLKENTSNKVTSISSASTNTQYPTAKCVYDIVGNIEATLQAIRGV